MSTATKQTLFRALIFANLGLLWEVYLTGFFGLILHGDWDIRGRTTIWMVLDYGILGVAIYPLSGWMIRRKFPLMARAAVYMLGIYVVEFISGEIFTACGLTLWNYSHLPYNIRGQIALTYAPIWYALGLVLETVNRWVDRCAEALALPRSSPET